MYVLRTATPRLYCMPYISPQAATSALCALHMQLQAPPHPLQSALPNRNAAAYVPTSFVQSVNLPVATAVCPSPACILCTCGKKCSKFPNSSMACSVQAARRSGGKKLEGSSAVNASFSQRARGVRAPRTNVLLSSSPPGESAQTCTSSIAGRPPA